MPDYAKSRGLITSYLYDEKMRMYPSYEMTGEHRFEDGDEVTGKYHKRVDKEGNTFAKHGIDPALQWRINRASYEWNDKKVMDFVNWYIKLHRLPERYLLENRQFVDSFKDGETSVVITGEWHSEITKE